MFIQFLYSTHIIHNTWCIAIETVCNRCGALPVTDVIIMPTFLMYDTLEMSLILLHFVNTVKLWTNMTACTPDMIMVCLNLELFYILGGDH